MDGFNFSYPWGCARAPTARAAPCACINDFNSRLICAILGGTRDLQGLYLAGRKTFRFFFYTVGRLEINNCNVLYNVCVFYFNIHMMVMIRPRFLESRLNYPTISGSTAIKFLILRITNLGIKERSWKQIYPWIS